MGSNLSRIPEEEEEKMFLSLRKREAGVELSPCTWGLCWAPLGT